MNTMGALLLVAVAAFFGGRLFLVAVLLLAGLALLEMSRELAAAGPRPVVIAAAVAGLGTPVWASLRPDDGLAALPALVVSMVLLAFCLMMVSGRRHATAALAATMLCGLLVGLGAGALVLLGLQNGWQWVAGVVATVAVVEVAGALGRPLPGSRALRPAVFALVLAPAAYLLAVALAT